jgi:hypothetical protein
MKDHIHLLRGLDKIWKHLENLPLVVLQYFVMHYILLNIVDFVKRETLQFGKQKSGGARSGEDGVITQCDSIFG